MAGKTLWLGPRFTQDSIRLRREALRRGWGVERVTGWTAREAEGGDASRAVVYAETLVAHAIAARMGGALEDVADDWLAGCPEWALGRSVRAMTLGEARGLEGEWFIKPASEKWFQAGVFEGGGALPRVEGLEEGDPVLVSGVVRFASEFRCFVRDGEVRAASVYARWGRPCGGDEEGWPCGEEELSEARAFCWRVVEASGRLPRGVVVDVGQLDGGEWAVVEANPVWGAGVYGCAAGGVLEALEAGAVLGIGVEDRD
jgi:hypothetical protein